VAEAKRWILDELLPDFPFVSDADRAHAIAELLLIPARSMIAGATPLHVHEAPAPGTGKDLLAEVMGLIVLGEDPQTMNYTASPPEMGKKLLATLMRAPEWITMPNVTGIVDDTGLTDAISRGAFADRVLGVSQIARLPARNVWTMTANNAELSGDLARRSVRIRIDAKVERPQDRTDFRHPDLRSWVESNRGQLLWSALTIVQSWVSAGMVRSDHMMGTFKDWAGVMGGILTHAQIPGFLENAKEFAQAADGDALARRALVSAWWEKYQRDPVGASSLYGLIGEADIDLDLGDRNEHGRKSRLGHILKTMRDRRYTLSNGYTVSVSFSGEGHRANLWSLHLIDRGDVE
jgi:hypothetical protein